ncbi:hypothetical protein RHMOL_Rhmol07G0144900 [Rhododendron molle]|uniref:Uncharacterized protein n=1 Tax=Rhododendron molle TaxID=49168 RepID=A0ACC0N1A4_RHOML|nr:hypothetical protein RHMOL_Rhmol07G0144900 [Rhododendron molle]
MYNHWLGNGGGQEAENGFKPGFFTVLEKKVEKVMPESKLKASPCIDSKVKYWRQTYAKLTDILKLSGFGWDHVNKRIDMDDEVWIIYEEAHPKKAKEVGGKRFPYFEDWEFLFGKDRANGEGTEIPSKIARLTQNENDSPNAQIEANEDCYYFYFDEEFHRNPTSGLTGMSNEIPLGLTPPLSTPPAPTTPVSTTSNSAHRTSLQASTPRTSTPPANSETQKGKKRTRMSDMGSLAASMEVWLKKSASHMEKMTNAMEYSNKLSACRTQVPLELEKLDLTNTQRFRVGAIICAAEDQLDLFYGIKNHQRQAWVEAILDGLIFGPV